LEKRIREMDNPLPTIFSRLLFLCVILTSGGRAGDANDLVAFAGPAKLSFDELLHLAADETPPPADAERLRRLLSEPFISNEATLSGMRPVRPTDGKLGPVLRVAEWNIARGVNLSEIQMSLSRSGDFERALKGGKRADAKKLVRIKQELAVLRGADVVILNEVDLGMKRTGYRDVARTLAQALHFNYVYGVEFVELNRLYLGERHMDTASPREQAEEFGMDPKRYLGLEGNAILARYPIRGAKIVQLPQCYDWFHGEMKQISGLESAKRWSAQKLFDERVRRQVRRGERMSLIVDLAVPEAPGAQVTIVAPHLEDYCPSECRQAQMAYLLGRIKNIANPVILGGDLNTNGHDGTPTSVRREFLKRLLDYHFWVQETIFFLAPVPFAGVLSASINYVKNFHDPTALNMRFVAANRAKPLFNAARDFQFADGGVFDFAGKKSKTTHHRGRTLAQSNERARKGFAPTFFFRRTYLHFLGNYKLDWLFVKPAPGAGFPPYYGRTLQNLNTALEKRISDHCPIAVDLPLEINPVNR
jgi:endonuclease/exonuclease/phosphatase family metal-dependent hydrolase